MLNREQRRKFQRGLKHNKAASICPECGKLSLFFTDARGPKDTVVICRICDAVVREGEEVTKLIPPGIWLPNKLEIFDQFLLAEAARIEEENAIELDEDGKGETIE